MKSTAPVVVFFALLFLYTKFVGPIPFFVNSVSTQKTDVFSVSGMGKVSVSPDIATATVGVQAQGATVKQVQMDINTVTANLTSAVKNLGISDKDIKTSNYSIYPDYDYADGKSRIRGYNASSNLTVKIRDLDRTNEVIDAATANGANMIGGLSFDIEDKAKAENEARKLAIENAKAKAEAAASAGGFRLGKIINYSENTGGIEPPILYGRADMLEKSAQSATQVEKGTNEIQISVSLSYALE